MARLPRSASLASTATGIHNSSARTNRAGREAARARQRREDAKRQRLAGDDANSSRLTPGDQRERGESTGTGGAAALRSSRAVRWLSCSPWDRGQLSTGDVQESSESAHASDCVHTHDRGLGNATAAQSP